MRRGFSWVSIQAGLVAPIFLLELAPRHPIVMDRPPAGRGRWLP
jgi:hypothetical protein